MKKIILFILLGVSMISCTNLIKKNAEDMDNGKYFNTKDMAYLDQVYVPALFLTNKNEKEKSKKAIESLEKEWANFSEKNEKTLSKKEKAEFNEISKVIATSKEIIYSDKPLVEAHEELEAVRGILYTIRVDRGIEYYMDKVTAFHTVMEDVLNNKESVEKINEYLPELKARLNELETYNFDASEYLFTEEKNNKRLVLIAAEKKAVSNLEKAIEENKLNDKVALAIKPKFIELFVLFGK